MKGSVQYPVTVNVVQKGKGGGKNIVVGKGFKGKPQSPASGKQNRADSETNLDTDAN